jgi:hypothetical protein
MPLYYNSSENQRLHSGASNLRVRANRTTGEVEVEGSAALVTEWWERLWPEVAGNAQPRAAAGGTSRPSHLSTTPNASMAEVPEVFGEYFNEFRSDVTDVDKMLIAGAFVQAKDPDRVFATKNANELLIDQNVKVTNASEGVRRLIASKRAFVVADGKFRISTQGVERLKSLKVQAGDAESSK